MHKNCEENVFLNFKPSPTFNLIKFLKKTFHAVINFKVENACCHSKWTCRTEVLPSQINLRADIASNAGNKLGSTNFLHLQDPDASNGLGLETEQVRQSLIPWKP